MSVQILKPLGIFVYLHADLFKLFRHSCTEAFYHVCVKTKGEQTEAEAGWFGSCWCIIAGRDGGDFLSTHSLRRRLTVGALHPNRSGERKPNPRIH